MQGVKKMAVASYDEIEKVQDVGNSNRTVGATLMNATSSRAHTIVTISLTQLMKEDGRTKELSSDIVLVDLAGSERAESTGATGARLQEGIEINVSLSALGNVISALAEKANNPTKKVFIPYRSHCLTELLQSALGGNSKTIMVCHLGLHTALAAALGAPLSLLTTCAPVCGAGRGALTGRHQL